MKRTHLLGVVSAAVFLITTVVVAVASGRGGGGWGTGGAYQRMYNPSTVETVSGTVEKIDRITPMRGMGSGIHLLLKTDKETVPVHLGPEWFISKINPGIEKGQKLEITGSRVAIQGKAVIIASEVKRGDDVLVLRDSAGIPVWSGWRRR